MSTKRKIEDDIMGYKPFEGIKKYSPKKKKKTYTKRVSSG
jgi:hypothetical protein